MVNNRRQLPAEGEDVWETRRQKWPDSPSDLEIGGCKKIEGSSSTPLEWFAAVLVTWGYWQLGEAKGSPKSCSLTLPPSSLLLSGIPSLFKVINNQNSEVNTFFKNNMVLGERWCIPKHRTSGLSMNHELVPVTEEEDHHFLACQVHSTTVLSNCILQFCFYKLSQSSLKGWKLSNFILHIFRAICKSRVCWYLV